MPPSSRLLSPLTHNTHTLAHYLPPSPWVVQVAKVRAMVAAAEARKRLSTPPSPALPSLSPPLSPPLTSPTTGTRRPSVAADHVTAHGGRMAGEEEAEHLPVIANERPFDSSPVAAERVKRAGSVTAMGADGKSGPRRASASASPAAVVAQSQSTTKLPAIKQAAP